MADKIVDAGFAIGTNLISGIGGTVPKYAQHGTGATAPAHGDTTLQTPCTDARVSGTVTRQTTNVTNDDFRVTATVVNASGGNEAVTEAGLFDAAGTGSPATGGNMWGRSTFSVINIANGASIAYQFDTTLTSAT